MGPGRLRRDGRRHPAAAAVPGAHLQPAVDGDDGVAAVGQGGRVHVRGQLLAQGQQTAVGGVEDAERAELRCRRRPVGVTGDRFEARRVAGQEPAVVGRDQQRTDQDLVRPEDELAERSRAMLGGERELTGHRVPPFDGPVEAERQQPLAVVRDRDRADAHRLPDREEVLLRFHGTEAVPDGTGRDVPHQRHAIESGAHGRGAVREDRDRTDLTLVRGHRLAQRARVDVPYAYDPVEAGGEQGRAVGRHRDGVEMAVVAAEGPDQPAAGDAPQPGDAVVSRREQAVAARREGYGPDRSRMAGERCRVNHLALPTVLDAAAAVGGYVDYRRPARRCR